MKVYDYINRVDKRFRLRSTRVCRRHSPLSLLCITMILRVRRNFFEITTFPNRAVFNVEQPLYSGMNAGSWSWAGKHASEGEGGLDGPRRSDAGVGVVRSP